MIDTEDFEPGPLSDVELIVLAVSALVLVAAVVSAVLR